MLYNYIGEQYKYNEKHENHNRQKILENSQKHFGKIFEHIIMTEA